MRNAINQTIQHFDNKKAMKNEIQYFYEILEVKNEEGKKFNGEWQIKQKHYAWGFCNVRT